MADTVSYNKELKMEALFVDGDTRTFSIKNPKSTITQNEISTLNSFMQENSILVGDKYGGRFGRITKAETVNKSTITLDLEDDS
mgnify:CR=1 FL=1